MYTHIINDDKKNNSPYVLKVKAPFIIRKLEVVMKIEVKIPALSLLIVRAMLAHRYIPNAEKIIEGNFK
jgi:hypothetical protein